MAKLYALLVGIDDYRRPMEPLDGCRNDLGHVEELLRGRVAAADLRLRTLLDAQATRAAVVGGFRRHLGQAGPDDTALFWFSGHGSTAPLPPDMPFAEASGDCQTMVCYDSRHDDVPDLYDKELAVLVHEVVDRGAHLVTVQDCCHSESGMRGAASGLRARVAPPVNVAPLPGTLLPELGAGGLVPGAQDPRHVALSACQAFELANELQFGKRAYGAFTRALLQAVAHLGGDATYREVMAVARTRVNVRYRQQVPVLEPRDPGGIADRRFLGGLLRPAAAQVTMLRVDGTWTIDIGSLHGLTAPVDGEETRFAVHGSSPLQEVRVTAVQTERSVVEPVGWRPDGRRPYQVVLSRVPLPVVGVTIDGEADGGVIGRLTDAIAVAAPGGGPSPHVRVVSARELAGDGPGLRVTVRHGGPLQITSLDGVPLATPVAADEAGIRQTVQDLEHVARWLHIRNLDNPGSALRDAVRLEVLPAAPGERILADDQRPDLGPGPITAAYTRTADGWEPPSIFIRLTNTTDHRLYCVLLDLTDTHRIHAALFPGEHIAAHWTTAAGNGRPIRLTLPRGRTLEPGARVSDWFMLVVAEEPFSAEPFQLPRLREKAEPGKRGVAAFTGIPDRLGLAAARRDAETAPATGTDWAVTVVEVTTTVPA
ncbi:caspase family protein [Plantactinospora soyae]|uniref:Peptidase C14 caspase domain-containing protein n=1 Tax=Plantactinospora soyae TaxID=1544732 RepID=A0A927M095_9ACTN|nr:caspase family protein [Plantactinospora soyae]MBE1484392.1 hypothetical protein [Plantactinospora soyae]